MKRDTLNWILWAAASLVSAAGIAQADVFDMPWGLISLEMVPVGNPGNVADTRYNSVSVGSVGYNYQIGKYEVTVAQYTEFLNAKATVGDSYGLYSLDMDPAHFSGGCGIKRSGGGTALDPYMYSDTGSLANLPVTCVSFWDAARFTNWLNNGQGDGDTETGAYDLNSYNGSDGRDISRNAGAIWFLPSEDEWYKAAYHKNDGATGNYWDYPTGADLAPGHDTAERTNPGNNANYDCRIGPLQNCVPRPGGTFALSDSPYGTFDQGGNVWEWNEALLYETSSSRGVRGGSFVSGANTLSASLRYYCSSNSSPTDEFYDLGFRVASVPEPGSATLLVCGAIGVLAYARRRRVRSVVL